METEEEQVKKVINTACQSIEEYAIQLKGRAQDRAVRGALVVEFGVNPNDGGIRQVGAVSAQEAAFSALLIQKMVGDSISGKSE